MSFLAPLFLAFGAAAAVPLLLHLLRRNISTRVDFPAARYLQRAELEHSRSLRIRNLLLMLLRVLLVLALAFAAARPFVRGVGVGHGPAAVAIVLDNSLSTTAIVSGVPTFDRLRDAARVLLRAATPADRLWLVTADGRVRGGTRDALLGELASIAPVEWEGDLPLALRRAASATEGSGLPARVIAVASDGQRSAWRSVTRVASPVAVFVPGGTPPTNRAVAAMTADPARWTPRGSITARVDAPDSVGYRVVLGERTLARGTTGRDAPVQLRAAPPERGWQALRVELEPDDFPADDARADAVWIGASPSVLADASAGPFVATALATLVADGRAAAGRDVAIGSADMVTRLPALLTPPADGVRIGAANRALARLGVPWRFGALLASPAIARGGRLDGVDVSARYRLEPTGTAAVDTIATAAGEPWMVAGPGYVIVASHLDPAATTLPVRASFVPWLADVLALRLGAPAGDLGTPLHVRPGAVLRLPAGVSALESAAGARRSVGTEVNAPAERGVWFMLRGARRVGALVVEASADESSLARWAAPELAGRITTGRVDATSSADRWAGDAFAGGSRRPALIPLLVLALLLLGAEAVAVRSSRTSRSIAA